MQMNMIPKNCKTYYDIKASKKRFIINQGGSRSGKTYSTMQIIIEACMENSSDKMIIDIVRKFSSSHDGACLQDFKEILIANRLWQDRMFHKHSKIYLLNGHKICFVGLDQPQKIRGRKRDLAYLNEANELSEEDFIQINMRTTGRVILDFNPSFVKNKWIDGLIDSKEKCDFFVTTWKDNPHLSKSQIQELEDLAKTDPIRYLIYAKGERAVPMGQVFKEFNTIDDVDFNALDEVYIGLDWGYNEPMALVVCGLEWGKSRHKLYCKELIYQNHIEIEEYRKLFRELGIKHDTIITADNQRPDVISLLQADYMENGVNYKGYNVQKCTKTDESILAGISQIKGFDIFLVDSENLLKEFNGYNYKEQNNNIKEIPKAGNDHGIDAIRYALQPILYGENSKKDYVPDDIYDNVMQELYGSDYNSAML
jgi:phage terminase large subunit